MENGCGEVKIYILWYSEEFRLEDIPVKYFTDKIVAEAWKEDYTRQLEEEVAPFDKEFSASYYVSEVEIEETLNFDRID